MVLQIRLFFKREPLLKKEKKKVTTVIFFAVGNLFGIIRLFIIILIPASGAGIGWKLMSAFPYEDET